MGEHNPVIAHHLIPCLFDPVNSTLHLASSLTTSVSRLSSPKQASWQAQQNSMSKASIASSIHHCRLPGFKH